MSTTTDIERDAADTLVLELIILASILGVTCVVTCVIGVCRCLGMMSNEKYMEL